MKSLLPILLLAAHLAFADEVKVQYRLSGLFQPDRVDDLRRQAGTLEAGEKTALEIIKLVDVNFETCVVTFAYDADSKEFKRKTPEQVLTRVNELLRQKSKGAFSITSLTTLKPDQLKMERIAVAGHDCKGCNFGLYRSIASIDGVERAVASFKEGHVTAWIDPAKTNREALLAALKKKEVDVLETRDGEKAGTKN